MSYIYVVTNHVNNKQYVGKTSRTLEERFSEHIKDRNRKAAKNRPLYHAINKYGKENFSISLLEECSEEDSFTREQYWINKLNTYHNGYNATLGGDGKPLYDYKQIALEYQKIQNINKVAALFNCDVSVVTSACQVNNVKILSREETNKLHYGKPVFMIDKNTKETINSFQSLNDASYYLIDNKLTNCKLGTIRTHISEVCRGKRKSAAGYIWKFQ